MKAASRQKRAIFSEGAKIDLERNGIGLGRVREEKRWGKNKRHVSLITPLFTFDFLATEN